MARRGGASVGVKSEGADAVAVGRHNDVDGEDEGGGEGHGAVGQHAAAGAINSWSMTKSTQCEEAKIAIKSAELAIGDNPGATKLVQTKRHGYTEAWFGPSNHKTLSGIALYKEFPHSQHSFSLIETTIAKEGGRDPITDAIKVVV